jgi:hypothetical protein
LYLVPVRTVAQSQWVTAVAVQWMAGQQHNCRLWHCNCHVFGSINGGQLPDIDAKGVYDGCAIAMGYCGNSALGGGTAAMGDGGGI